MLPGKINERDIPQDDYTRYGLASMIKIIWEMLERGAERENITARVFGGGNIIQSLNTPDRPGNISSNNIRMAKLMLEMEDIPIVVWMWALTIPGRLFLMLIQGECTSVKSGGLRFQSLCLKGMKN
jgi:chemotaxis receptor (MCP) glutamine deamidase CheD